MGKCRLRDWSRWNLNENYPKCPSTMATFFKPIPPLAFLLLVCCSFFFGAKKNSENQTLFYAICARFFLFISFVVFWNDDGERRKRAKTRRLFSVLPFWCIVIVIVIPRPFSCLGFVFLLFFRLFSLLNFIVIFLRFIFDSILSLLL